MLNIYVLLKVFGKQGHSFVTLVTCWPPSSNTDHPHFLPKLKSEPVKMYPPTPRPLKLQNLDKLWPDGPLGLKRNHVPFLG